MGAHIKAHMLCHHPHGPHILCDCFSCMTVLLIVLVSIITRHNVVYRYPAQYAQLPAAEDGCGKDMGWNNKTHVSVLNQHIQCVVTCPIEINTLPPTFAVNSQDQSTSPPQPSHPTGVVLLPPFPPPTFSHAHLPSIKRSATTIEVGTNPYPV